MPGLSNQLYNRCRNTLLKCSEFDSDASLRALFVITELRPFQNGLPEAKSKQDRVDQSLSFFLSKRLSDGRQLLTVVMAILRDRYQDGDALFDELRMLSYEIERVMSTKPEADLAKNQQHSSAISWNTSNIRKLLKSALNDDELNSLCFDYFRSVYDTFAAGMSRTQKIQSLLEYCVRNDQVEKLLSLIRGHNPAQYTRYESQLRINE